MGPTDWKAYVELSRLCNWHNLIADRSESGPGSSEIMSHARQIPKFQQGVSYETSYRSKKMGDMVEERQILVLKQLHANSSLSF